MLPYITYINISISNKIFSSRKKYKYFICYLDDFKMKPFSIILPKTSVYVKSYDGETKWIYFSIKDDYLLEKYNDIWNNVQQ